MRLKLSRQGRCSLEAGLDAESLEMTLLMEVMKHVDEDISEENLCDLLDELVDRCGSIENAIVALKTSEYRIEKDPVHRWNGTLRYLCKQATRKRAH